VRRLTGGVTLSDYYGVLDDVVAELDERTWMRRS
jgi:hypothetical protein